MSLSRPLLIPVFSLTLLLSAFLVFLIEPMFGKMILPLLGGSPSVWNTAMLFFQCLLLAGYGYAHWLARLRKPMWQAAIHIALLFLFTMALPVMVPEGWIPPVSGNPIFWQLGLMTVAAGGPFFILSASAPLLQHWFSESGHKDAHNPYFLYAASNIGSVTALLLYPFVIEPALTLGMQTGLWMVGYWLLLIMVSLSALLSIRREQVTEAEIAGPDDDVITWQRRALWVALAFVPSSLMLGVTTFITTDLAAVPLIWIVPLALYVASFIVAFARRPVPDRRLTAKMQGIAMIIMAGLLASYLNLSLLLLILVHLVLFFLTALMCHQELVALRPGPRHLTQFYLVMAAGGALGGVFNALLAPCLFVIPAEYGIVLALAGFMRMAASPDQSLAGFLQNLNDARKRSLGELFRVSGFYYLLVTAAICLFTLKFMMTNLSIQMLAMLAIVWTFPALLRRRFVFAACALIVIAFHPPGHIWTSIMFSKVVHRERNFFGILRVAEKPDGTIALIHGTTVHGVQSTDPRYRLIPLSYYSKYSGIADAFTLIANYKGDQKIAVLGLGGGATACYAKAGRHFDFYEIDPAVIRIAQDPQYFTFLKDCGSPYTIVPGDARLLIAKAPDKSYDLILLDAFSSDNIPVHLLTAEAMRIYKSKLSDRGILVLHISNKYLDLRPVAAAAAQEIGMESYDRIHMDGKLEDSGLAYNANEYIIMTRDKTQGAALEKMEWHKIGPEPDIPLWTDQYSNIFSILKMRRPGNVQSSAP